MIWHFVVGQDSRKCDTAVLIRSVFELDIMTVAAPNSTHASATAKPTPAVPPIMRARAPASLDANVV